MLLKQLLFHEYYQKYLIIEADFLTEKLGRLIRVEEDDCFVLCSSCINNNGVLLFLALAIGNSYETCTKGLDEPYMFGYYFYEEVENLECRVITPTLKMLKKASPLLAYYDGFADGELKLTRKHKVLDPIRSCNFPDIVKASVLTSKGIVECNMLLKMFNGPFIEGKYIKDPRIEIEGLKPNETLRALPYKMNGYSKLIVILAGDDLSSEEMENYIDMIQQGSKIGLGFAKDCIKN